MTVPWSHRVGARSRFYEISHSHVRYSLPNSLNVVLLIAIGYFRWATPPIFLVQGELAMLYKTMIGITAAVILSSASAAFSYEDPENKIGDRYPFLEQRYTPVAATTLRGTILRVSPASNLAQYAYEAPENKISDRYPLLEMGYAPVAARTVAVRYQVPRAASSSVAYEAPENRISDRYPLLEQQYAFQGGPARRTASRRNSTTAR
jgi:hypothetical protein